MSTGWACLAKPVFLRKRYQHIEAPINKSATALDVIPVHKTHYQVISVCECGTREHIHSRIED